MNFEEDVRSALRREPAPEGFAARVLAKAAQSDKVAVFPGWRRPAVWAIAAGIAAAALLPPAAPEYRHRREAEQGLEARKELFVALRITRAKLQQSRERVHRAIARDTARHTL